MRLKIKLSKCLIKINSKSAAFLNAAIFFIYRFIENLIKIVLSLFNDG